MFISFGNIEVRNICEDSDLADVQLGVAVATELRTRLAELWAISSVHEILVGDPQEIGNAPLTNYKIDLSEGYRLVFCSNHIKQPLADGKINWSDVRRIKILNIENTNE